MRSIRNFFVGLAAAITLAGNANSTLAGSASCTASILGAQQLTSIPKGMPTDTCNVFINRSAKSMSGGDIALIDGFRDDLGIVVQSTSFANFYASYGRLQVSASNEVRIANGGVGGGGISDARAAFTDSITVSSGHAPIGTPVRISYRYELQFSQFGLYDSDAPSRTEFDTRIFSGFGIGSLSRSFHHLANQSGELELPDSTYVSGRTVVEGFLNARVGDVLDLSSRLHAATALTGSMGYGYLTDYFGAARMLASSFYPSGSRLSIDVVEDGMTLSSASGFNYSLSAIPEPSSAGLLVAGLVLFALVSAGATIRRRWEGATRPFAGRNRSWGSLRGAQRSSA